MKKNREWKMKNWLIKKIGGYTTVEMQSNHDTGYRKGLGQLRNTVVSVRLNVSEKEPDRLSFLAGFIDYICEKASIERIYNNGSYERFIKEM